jgi:Zn-dependent protease with chaperone function
MLILAFPRFITIALGAGIASIGVLIMIFLLKFMFKAHKVDRSHLVEIKREDEPMLFEMIDDVVHKVDTHFPKKVYLSSEVNASVFYDSSFWSMFFPVRKNLVIGVGLANSVTTSELKAILGHEFGHFSQKTMKVGSYVYNVNQIIYNMLYDNSSYESLISKWASLSSYISIFVLLAVKIVGGIQWVLQKMYEFVNKQYMSLSREMEFHADEIAAHVTGYEPLQTALLRLDIANDSLQSVFQFYEKNHTDSLISKNLFENQSFVMLFKANKEKIETLNGFPNIVNEEPKFNKSKLVIDDQWASHPSTKDRIDRLTATQLKATEIDNSPANSLFYNTEKIQQLLTKKLFDQVEFKNTKKEISSLEFKTHFQEHYEQSTFPEIFNGYYDNRNPAQFDMQHATDPSQSTIDQLFRDDILEKVYTLIHLENDVQNLMHIVEKKMSVKTFDYDGKKFPSSDANSLTIKLKQEIELLSDELKHHDKLIYDTFLNLEFNSSKEPKLKSLYDDFLAFDKDFDSKFNIYHEMHHKLSFIELTTEIEDINSNFRNLKGHEAVLKNQINELLLSPTDLEIISKDAKESFDSYLSKDWVYFGTDQYFNESLEVLFSAINYYANSMSEIYLHKKRGLLKYQAELTVEKPVSVK